MSKTDTKASTTIDIKALTAIIETLAALAPEDRQRTVQAAMMFLGTPTKPAVDRQLADEEDHGEDTAAEDYPAAAEKWMAQNHVSRDQLGRAFHFKGDGKFELHDAPGASKRERALNTYILTGVGKYLATENREFDDATARAFCKKIGCFDAANHSYTIKSNKGGEFSGDTKAGFMVTNIGLKRGAELVKALGASNQ
jgi:hypothetical protein